MWGIRQGLCALATALWLGFGFSTAQAQLPAMKLVAADLVSPSQAWSFYGSATTHTLGLALAADPGPEIRAVSRSLGASGNGKDSYTQNVFDYVRNNIEVEFRFGLAKGARGALINQSGTPFDQADLMVKLLDQAGVPNVAYKVGTITLTGLQFGQWTGLVTNPGAAPAALAVDARAACQLLADGGIPAIVNNQTTCAAVTGTLSTVTLAHIWVAANGNLYDPSFKRHTLKPGQDIASLMGCGPSSASTCGAGVLAQMMVNATQPTVNGFVGVKDANQALAVGAVQTWAANLQHRLETNNPGQGLDDVIGGKRIDASYAPAVSASLPYPALEQINWSDVNGIPDKYRSVLNVVAGSINQTFFSDEISTRIVRLAAGTLYADDSLVQSCGTGCITYPHGLLTLQITLTASHPYAYQHGAFASNSITGPMGDLVTVIQGWGDGSPQTQKFFSDLQAVDSSPTSQGRDEVPFAVNFLVQRSMFNRLAAQVSGSTIGTHNTIGMVTAQLPPETLPATSSLDPNYDMTAISTVSVTPATYSTAAASAAFETSSLVQVAIEGSVSQQARHAPVTVSAIAAFVDQNRQHSPFVLVPSASVVSFGQAQGGDPSFYQMLSNGRYDYMTATDPVLYVWGQPFLAASFKIALRSDANAYILLDGFGLSKGATTPAPTGADPEADIIKSAHATEAGRRSAEASVNEATGGHAVAPPADIVTGVGDFPFSLPFKRFYSSDNGTLETLAGPQGAGIWPQGRIGVWRYSGADEDSNSHLGGGWTHNFQITASIVSNPQKTFGRDSALDASAAIAVAYVLNDLFKTPDLQHRMAAMFAASWLSDQLPDNAVVVSLPPTQEVFLKLPDGRFNAPPGSAASLVQTNGRAGPYSGLNSGSGSSWDYSLITFTRTDKDGARINFSIGSLSALLIPSQPTKWIGDPVFKADTWAFPNGLTINFNYQPESVSWLDAAGLVADAGGLGPTYQHYYLTSVSNSLGRTLTFTNVLTGGAFSNSLFTGSLEGYNVGHRITAVTDDSGRSVQFALAGCPQVSPGPFDASAVKALACNTFTATDPMTLVSKYEYAADSYSPDPSVIVRPNYKLRRIYSAGDPANIQTYPLLFIAYDDLLRVATEMDALNRVTTHLSGGIAEEIWKRAVKIDARGNSWLSLYDENNSEFQSVDPTNAVTQKYYDPMRRITKTINPELDTAEQAYDVRSNVVSTLRTPKPGSPLMPLRTTTTLSEGIGVITCTNPKTCNKPTRITDAIGAVSDYTWDAGSGELTQILQPADIHGVRPERDFTYTATTMGSDTVQLLTAATKKISSSQSVTTTYAYNSANKFVLGSATIDPTGLNLTTTLGFDSIGNVLQITDPRTDTTNLVWDSDRRLTYLISPDPDGAGPAARTTQHWTYDDDGLFTAEEKGTSTSALAAGYTALLRTEFAHDAVGNRVQEAVRDLGSGSIIALTQLSYDPTDNLACTAVRMDPTTFGAPPSDACTPVAANINTPLQDRVTFNGYNFRGELTETDRGYFGQAATNLKALAIESFGYSPNGQRTQITDANGNLTTLQYDGFDRLASQIYPVLARGARASNAADHEDFSYDGNGNRLSFRRRNGQSLTYVFDNLNRVIEKHLEADAPHDVYYDYDLAGRMTSARFAGPAGLGTILTYDLAGRLTQDQTFGRSVTSTLDPAGNRIAVTLFDGFSTLYDYDAANRLVGLREPAQAACPATSGGGAVGLVCIFYDPLGRRAHMDRGNGGYADYAYDGAGRLSALTQAGTDTQKVSLQTVSFSPASQATSLVQQSDAYTWVGRPPMLPSRTFDGLNRDATYTVLSGYSANGNLTGDGARALTYDLENRLISVGPAPGQSGLSMALTYDPLGRLSQTTATTGSSSTVTNFLYDGDRLLGEYDNLNHAVRHYVHGGGIDEPLVWYEGLDETSPKSWLHADRQGSIIATSNATGAVTTYSFGPYGETSSWGPMRFAYTGQIALPEAQLYHDKARVYDPMMGRFLQTDPIGQQDDPNLYTYVKDDPTNRTDPSGTESAQTTLQTLASIDADQREHPDPQRARTELIATGVVFGGAGGCAAGGCEAITGRVVFAAARQIAKEVAKREGWAPPKKSDSGGVKVGDGKGNQIRVERKGAEGGGPEVKETRGGTVRDAKGNPVQGDRPSHAPEAHIPAIDWIKQKLFGS